MTSLRFSRQRSGLALPLIFFGLVACSASDESGTTSAAPRETGVVSDDGDHGLRAVPAGDAPEVALEVTADSHGGWNVHLTTTKFRFTPENINRQVVGGEGHAHLYVDGVKYTRVYSEWYFLPASALTPGEHTLKVTLNANDHTAWAVGNAAASDSVTINTSDAASSPHTHSHTHHNSPAPAN